MPLVGGFSFKCDVVDFECVFKNQDIFRSHKLRYPHVCVHAGALGAPLQPISPHDPATMVGGPYPLPPITIVVMRPEGGKRYCNANKADSLVLYNDLLAITKR